MNAGVDEAHPTIHYYDGDCPSEVTSPYPENVDPAAMAQGIVFDVPRYREIVRATKGPVLELCCGTGRVAIPIARDGYPVTAVDVSAAMLERFRKHLEKEKKEVVGRLELVEGDVTRLQLLRDPFNLVICALNSFLLIPDRLDQQRTLKVAARHLEQGGILVLDVVNPLSLSPMGDPVARPYFTRRSPHSGNPYTLFGVLDPFDTEHRQRMHGWYDEVDPDGRITRRHFSMIWRPVHRFELEMMLQAAGFELLSIEGGARLEPYHPGSPRMFVRARKT